MFDGLGRGLVVISTFWALDKYFRINIYYIGASRNALPLFLTSTPHSFWEGQVNQGTRGSGL